MQAGTLTLAVDGGTPKPLHNTSQTVVVPDNASIERDAMAVTLADVLVGDEVHTKGTVSANGSLTALQVRASSPDPEEEPTELPAA